MALSGFEDCGLDPMVRRQFSGETGPKDHFQGGVPDELQSLNARSIEATKKLYYVLWRKKNMVPNFLCVFMGLFLCGGVGQQEPIG